MSRPTELDKVRLLRKRLSGEQVGEHFQGLAEQGQGIEIRIKGAPGNKSDATAEDLQAAAARLLTGELTAVQIRFFQEDAWWCDTVLRKGDDFRLVRMRQEEPPTE